MPPILLPHWNGPVPKSQVEADALKQSLLNHQDMTSKGDIIIEPMPEPASKVPFITEPGVLNPWSPDYPLMPSTGVAKPGEVVKI